MSDETKGAPVRQAVPCKYLLRDVTNGLERYEHDYYCLWRSSGSDGECVDGGGFIWEEGNYSCDCNRALMLYGDDRYGCNVEDNKIVLVRIDHAH